MSDLLVPIASLVPAVLSALSDGAAAKAANADLTAQLADAQGKAMSDADKAGLNSVAIAVGLASAPAPATPAPDQNTVTGATPPDTSGDPAKINA